MKILVHKYYTTEFYYKGFKIYKYGCYSYLVKYQLKTADGVVHCNFFSCSLYEAIDEINVMLNTRKEEFEPYIIIEKFFKAVKL